MKKYIAISTAVLVSTASSLLGVDFSWQAPNTSGIFSDGSAIPTGGLTLEIGTFGAGFDLNDFDTWAAAFLTSGIDNNSTTWNNLGNASFPTFGNFGRTSIMRPGGDVQPGQQAYIWGYNSLDIAATSEWILLTNPAWTFPNTTAGSPVPTGPLWATSDPGTEALFGFSNHTVASGLANVMETQAIPEPSTYALIFGLGILGFLGFRRFRK